MDPAQDPRGFSLKRYSNVYYLANVLGGSITDTSYHHQIWSDAGVSWIMGFNKFTTV